MIRRPRPSRVLPHLRKDISPSGWRGRRVAVGPETGTIVVLACSVFALDRWSSKPCKMNPTSKWARFAGHCLFEQKTTRAISRAHKKSKGLKRRSFRHRLFTAPKMSKRSQRCAKFADCAVCSGGIPRRISAVEIDQNEANGNLEDMNQEYRLSCICRSRRISWQLTREQLGDSKGSKRSQRQYGGNKSIVTNRLPASIKLNVWDGVPRRCMHAAIALLGFLAMAGAWTGRARGQEPGIWGEVIMRQPFDAAPFRQVRVPAWVQEMTGCGYTLSGMDFEARAAAAAHGVTISEMGFVRPVLSLL